MDYIIEVTKDEKHRKKIEDALKKNNGYCPCQLKIKDKTSPDGYSQDTKCICKSFVELEEGWCHCGLYKKHIINRNEE